MNPDGRWKLRVAAILAIGGVVLALATDYIATQRTQEELRRRSEMELRASLNALRLEVATGIDQAVAIVDEAATDRSLADPLTLHDADGVVRSLGSLSARSKALTRVAAYDRNGWLVARTPMEADPLGRVSNGSAESPAWRVSDDDTTWTIERTVHSGTGPVGTLVAELSLRRTAPGAALFRLGSTGRASLVDRDGQVLLSGEQTRILTTVRPGVLRTMLRQWRNGLSEGYSAEVGRDEAIAFGPANEDVAVVVTRASAEVMAPAHELGRDLLAGDLLLALGIFSAWVLLYRQAEIEKRKARDLNSELNRSLALMPKISAPLDRVHSNLTGHIRTLRERGDVLPADARVKLIGRLCANVAVVGAIAERLTYAWQIETGRLEPVREAVPLEPLVAQAIENTCFDTSRHRIQTMINEQIAVVSDADALRRVLEEVISNAARYSPPDSLIIVRARRTGTEVIISIDDEGDGVEGKDVPKLFARPSANGVGGMGLWLVSKLIGKMGGRVWWEPEIQRGSTFSISLPDAAPQRPVIDLISEEEGAKTP